MLQSHIKYYCQLYKMSLIIENLQFSFHFENLFLEQKSNKKLLFLMKQKTIIALLRDPFIRKHLRKRNYSTDKIRMRLVRATRLLDYLPFVWHFFTSPIVQAVNRLTPLQRHSFVYIVFNSYSFKVIYFTFSYLDLKLNATTNYIAHYFRYFFLLTRNKFCQNSELMSVFLY